MMLFAIIFFVLCAMFFVACVIRTSRQR